MFDGKFRKGLDAITAPVGRGLVRIGVSADVLTASGLVFAGITAWSIYRGMHWPAIFLLTATGFHDMFDGAVAKASARASQRGSFFDSVVDRVSDSVLMIGCAALLVREQRGMLILLPLAIMTTTFMISYIRAKAESLGLTAKGGLMERAERMIVLGVALLHSSFFVPVMWALFGLTAMTAMGRFVRVWRQADSPERAPDAESRRWPRTSSRAHR
jgi:CDP-diacylglycerol---glycerol-3-phosphate 3-phosphatidyltransferase